MKKLTDTDTSPTTDAEVETQPQKEEEKKYTVRLTVYYVGRESTRINLGEQTVQQAQHTMAVLNAPYDALAQSKSLILTDVKGVTHIINTTNVTHIEVETE